MDSSVRSRLQLIKELPQMQQYILNGVISTGRQLGHGSFGSVIEVQLHGGAICAGKKIHEIFLHPRNEGVKQVIDKFVTECDLLSKMRHPNIVHFYGLAFIDDSSSPVLVMERLDRSLDDYLENTEAKDVVFSIRLSILHDVAKGLVFLHSHQPPIAHRDLTAKNILLTTMKKACIADLGNSRMIKKETLSRKLTLAPGTLVYMPPEATESPVAYDTSLDIFSFGHTALFVLCHRFPCSLLGPNYSDPKSRASNKLTPRTEVERRSEYLKDLQPNTQIPSQVVELVKSCLDNFPEQRPAAVTISELLDGHKKQAEECDRTMEKLQACSLSSGTVTSSRSTTATNTHMSNIKNGNRFMMEMQVAQGRRNARKTYIFQFDDKRLKYYSKLNDRRCKELKLENVRTVLPLYNEPTRFAVHFQHKGEENIWHLTAETEEERDCWIKVLRDAITSLSDDIPSPQTYSKNDLAYEYQYDFNPELVSKRKVSSDDGREPQQENMRRRSDTTPAGDLKRKPPQRKQRQGQPTYSMYVPSSPTYSSAYSGYNFEANQSYVSSIELKQACDIPVLQEQASLYCVTDLLDGSSKADESEEYDDIIISPKKERIVDEGQVRPLFLPKPQTYRKKPSRPVSPTMQYSPEHHKVSNIEGAKKVQLSPARSYGSSLQPPAPANPATYPGSTARQRPRTPKQGTSRPLKDLLISLHIPKDRLFDQNFIAKGEFGNIFHAKLLNLTGEEVDVAVKTLQICKDANERRNFEREMAISADPRLKHPNIVKVYGLVEGVDQIVMEYLPTGNLKQFLCKTSKPLNWLVKYMLDIAMGMDFLSERGLIHRDLAARNILMASGGENCKVSDFGLLRQLPDDMNYYIERSSGKCPIRWMAPESLDEKKFSFASDVWSYGVVAWEIFKPNCVPFKEYDNVQVVIKISRGARLKIPTHCPEEIETMVQSCWREEPMDRPTFRELATMLAHKIHAF